MPSLILRPPDIISAIKRGISPGWPRSGQMEIGDTPVLFIESVDVFPDGADGLPRVVLRGTACDCVWADYGEITRVLERPFDLELQVRPDEGPEALLSPDWWADAAAQAAEAEEYTSWIRLSPEGVVVICGGQGYALEP